MDMAVMSMWGQITMYTLGQLQLVGQIPPQGCTPRNDLSILQHIADGARYAGTQVPSASPWQAQQMQAAAVAAAVGQPL